MERIWSWKGRFLDGVLFGGLFFERALFCSFARVSDDVVRCWLLSSSNMLTEMSPDTMSPVFASRDRHEEASVMIPLFEETAVQVTHDQRSAIGSVPTTCFSSTLGDEVNLDGQLPAGAQTEAPPLKNRGGGSVKSAPRQHHPAFRT